MIMANFMAHSDDHSRKQLAKLQKPWLPYLVFFLGLVFSLFLSYIFFEDTLGYFNIFYPLKYYMPWLVLIFGLILSFLIAANIRIAQLAQSRALILRKTNKNLKKEILDRIHAEEIKQQLEIALLQGQKLQAIGTLAGGIAHDFNNILYAIIGYVEIIREDVQKDTVAYQNLGKVREAAIRGRELISRILEFSRSKQHRFEVIHLNETIEAILNLLRSTIPASVSIQFKADNNINILGNQTQIHQVLVNIINNAVDAMDGEGHIDIKMTLIKKDDLSLQAFPDMNHEIYCKLELKDSGRGMDEQTRQRIFEPFFTTKEVGKGTGLGLSIVHSIIKEHEGKILVSSLLGHGSTFTILLPVHQTD